jgi:hypothetical protein
MRIQRHRLKQAKVRFSSQKHRLKSVPPWNRLQPVRSTFSAQALACAVVLLSGCGYVGEPLYPALNIPVRIVDLGAVERGGNLELSFSIPAVTMEGLVIKKVGAIDLRVGPSSGKEFQLDLWAASARHIPLDSPATPQGVQISTPIEDFIGKDVVVGVRMAGSKGHYSAWSNLVNVSIETPLATPSKVAAEAAPEGVRIRWMDPGVAKFRIFRAVGENQPAQLGTSDEPTYLDTTAEYGKTYKYYVQAIHDKTESLVAESEPLTPIDTFAPAVPSGLTLSAAVASVELAWERDTEPDLKGYRIYRAVGDGQFELLAEVDVPTYSDTKVEAGKRYRYRITAFDQLNNTSEPSAEVAVTLP